MNRKCAAFAIYTKDAASAGTTTSLAAGRMRRLPALLLVITLSALGYGKGYASDNASAPALFPATPEQQKRLDAMKVKGPEASLTILPIMVAGRPFDRATDIVGALLEEQGLHHLELGRTPFIAGVKAEPRVLSASLTAFLKTNLISTDYALYAEFNGATLDEVRAVVVNQAGEAVWAERQTTQDKAFQALVSPRDPLTLIAFLVERLSPQLSLNEETAKNRSHELEDRSKAKSGYGPASETKERMPARLKSMKESRQQAALMVLGVRMDHAVNVTNASDVAKRISAAKLFRTAVPAKQSLAIEASMAGGDQMKYLWDIAREFQAFVKKNPPDADYVLFADYLFNRQNWRQGGVEFVVCDRQGEWVLAELTNSDQDDYRRVKPISAEGCDQLVVERLAKLMAVPLLAGSPVDPSATAGIAKPADSQPTAGRNGELLDPRDGAAMLKREGRPVKVKGRIVRFASATSGTYYYLNFDRDFRKSLSLTFRRADNPTEFRPELLQQYSNKVVLVEGTVTIFSGRPQILIKSLSEIQVQATTLSKELEGDWQGRLESPNGEFRLAFHFKSNPDQTFAATMDSNDHMGLPLDDVQQTGQKVEFAIKMAGDATFEGTLNKKGSELAGKLIHDGTGVPLTMRKK